MRNAEAEIRSAARSGLLVEESQSAFTRAYSKGGPRRIFPSRTAKAIIFADDRNARSPGR